MNVFYNNRPYKADLVFTRGDTVNMTIMAYRFDPSLNDWAMFDLSGKRVDAWFRRKDGLVVKQLTSSVSPATIIIDRSSFTFKDDPFEAPGYLDYDVQVTDGLGVFTIMTGMPIIKKDVTT